MGEKDIVTKEFMADPEIFADAFNFLLYGGKQVINPGKLKKWDPVATGVPYGKQGKAVAVQKFRDNFKYLTLMEDENTAYLALGIENQTDIHYAMPVRNMMYDALQYSAQVDEKARQHRKKAFASGENVEIHNERKHNAGEYLSGFYKDDRLIPVITLVVFFGSEVWDGPMSIHEMLEIHDKRVLRFLPDYRINLLAPAMMSYEEINRLHTSLREVMLFMKCAADKYRLKELLATDKGFQAIEYSAARVIRKLTNSSFDLNREEEVVNMRSVWDEMREDARMEGVRQGIEEGMEKGLLTAVSNLMESQELSREQAMEALKIPESDRATYGAKLR